MLRNLDFHNNTILSYFFFFFLIIDFYFLIPEMIPKIFIPTAELIIPTATRTNETNADTEMQPVTVETKIGKFST